MENDSSSLEDASTNVSVCTSPHPGPGYLGMDGKWWLCLLDGVEGQMQKRGGSVLTSY